MRVPALGGSLPVNATVHKIYAPRRRTQGSPSPASVPSKSAAAYGLSRLLVVVAALHSGCPFALRNATAPRPLTTYSKAAPVYLTQTLLLQSFSDNVFAMQAKAVAGTGTRRLIAKSTPPCEKCTLHAAGTQGMPAPASIPSDSAAAYGLSRSRVFVSRRHSAAFSPSGTPTAPRSLTTSPKNNTLQLQYT